MLVLALWYGRTIGLTALLFPVIVMLQLPAVAGLSMGLAALNVHFKDVKDIVQNLLTLLFFLTPIIYPLSFVQSPLLRTLLIWCNPVTAPTLAYHDLLLRGTLPQLDLLWPLLAWAVIVWIAGGWLFDRLSDSLAEAV